MLNAKCLSIGLNCYLGKARELIVKDNIVMIMLIAAAAIAVGVIDIWIIVEITRLIKEIDKFK